MERLEELEIAPASGCYGSPPGTSRMPPLTFRHLGRITVGDLDEGDYSGNGLCVLRELIQAAPNLSFLRLGGHWRIESDAKSLKAMGALQQLKTMINWDGDHVYDIGRDGISFCRHGKGPGDLMIEEATTEYGTWPEEEETDLEVSHSSLAQCHSGIYSSMTP